MQHHLGQRVFKKLSEGLEWSYNDRAASICLGDERTVAVVRSSERQSVQKEGSLCGLAGGLATGVPGGSWAIREAAEAITLFGVNTED